MSVKLFVLCKLIIFYLFLPHESIAVVIPPNERTQISIGVIVDESTRVGQEQRIAVNLATQIFNKKSNRVKLSLIFKNSSYNDPLQAASAAMELFKEGEVKAIIGMETWQEAALVARVASEYRNPVVSLAVAGPSTIRWLIQMNTNYPQQISCIAAMVKYYGWERIVAVYEDDGHAGASLLLTQLSQALRDSGSMVEHSLALPPFSVVVDDDEYSPKDKVLEEILKVLGTQSRVFVVLDCSLQIADLLFNEAKNVGLLGRESVWIVTESIAGLLESVDSTLISSMQGVVGIKSEYNETEHEFLDFKNNFFVDFQEKYRSGERSRPSIYALRAHDGIMAIGEAIEKLNESELSSEKLVEGILGSKTNGLTGKISFKEGGLVTNAPLRVVNVVGKMYKDLDLWTIRDGFFEDKDPRGEFKVFGEVDWPGGVRDHIPRGWAMPPNLKPLKIGVPGRTSFEKFVKVESSGNPSRTTYSGFCIDVFLEVVKIIEQTYALPYEFEAFYGTYDELVDCVHNKTYDAVVGDVTILANRSEKVEFTQPYAKSGLSMIVPYKSKESRKGWLFTKPFTWQMWVVTGALLVYTMMIVWFLEHRSNPDFSGSWKEQLNASMWFTFTSIFFLQREKINSNYTRVVVFVWLVTVFVLTQSYTANLTSMLTVPLLEPTTKNLNSLLKTNQPIGCDGDSFVLDYLSNVLNFSNDRIVKVDQQYAYPDMFDNHSIYAAFLEVPYKRAFLDQFCKDFTHAPLAYRLGGLGFVFQKGCPIAADASKAILQLSENGVLKSLDDKWFAPSLECMNMDNDTERLSIEGFWVIYLFSGATSTLCFFFYLFHLCRNYNCNRTRDGYDGVWIKLVRLANLYDNGSTHMSHSRPTRDEWFPATPPVWDYTPTPSDAGERLHSSPSTLEIELSTAGQ